MWSVAIAVSKRLLSPCCPIFLWFAGGVPSHNLSTTPVECVNLMCFFLFDCILHKIDAWHWSWTRTWREFSMHNPPVTLVENALGDYWCVKLACGVTHVEGVWSLEKLWGGGINKVKEGSINKCSGLLGLDLSITEVKITNANWIFC